MDTTVYESPRKMRALLQRLVSASGVKLIVAADHLAELVRDAISKSPALVNSVMVDSTRDFDPITATGVSTLALLTVGDDAAEWLDGNSRAPLTVICGAPESPVGCSGLTLGEQDGCYSLTDLEELY